MFEAWGRALYTRRRLTLGIALVLVAFAAARGTGVFGKLSSGNSFTPPASQSQREADQASQAFGSVVLPLKAIVMNVLSLSATFGVVVWIFQWGHLSRLLQFTPTGSIDPTMPILMLAIIFGLSMDYEVFLLSRIRERYDQTGDNTASVASGLQRTGGLITSLALLLIIVVGAFSASGITFIKLMGVGMIVALLVDATIIRVCFRPLRLLGRANWWAPRPLRRLYARYGISDEIHGPTPVPAGVEG